MVNNLFRRVLITGGCGFIGANLVLFLIKQGFKRIRILDNLSTGTKDNLEESLSEFGKAVAVKHHDGLIYELQNKLRSEENEKVQIELLIGDIQSYDTCFDATEEVNSIVHLAAHAGVIPSIKDPFYDFEINARGTLNLLQAAYKNKVDKFLFASSNAPLGDQGPPMSEELAPKPLSPYGASKLSCEGYCSAFSGSYGFKTIVFRFSNVYGPYCLHKDSVVSKFIKDGFSKGVLTIYGDGTQTRDFLYVEDLCRVISNVLQMENFSNSPDAWGEVFHLGTGKETSIINLANIIKKLFTKDIQVIHEPERKGEIKRNYSDISKAINLLNYGEGIPLQKGVQNTFNWLKLKIEG